MGARRTTAARPAKIRQELLTILDWISTPDSGLEDLAPRPARGPVKRPRPPELTEIQDVLDPQSAPGSPAEQRVYSAIRDAILDHRLAPGTKLKEVALAGLFSVSRATIRSVLARLGHGSLVELRLNRGAVVASPSAEESHAVFEARRAIESAIVAKAARIATAKDIAGLRDMVAAEKASYERGEERGGLRLSIDFHRELATVGRNAVLARYLDELVLRTPLIALTHRGHAPATCGYEEHLAVIDAIAARDEARAVMLMTQHIDHLEDELTRARPAPARTLDEIFGVPPSPQTDGIG